MTQAATARNFHFVPAEPIESYLPTPPQKPHFSYVFRRWFDDPVDDTSTQAEVIVINSPVPLPGATLLDKIGEAHAHAKDFVLVIQPANSAITLDTWEQGIDSYGEVNDAGARIFGNWWSAETITEIREIAVGNGTVAWAEGRVYRAPY